MKYMLIEVMEREISEPEYFDTHDAAHDEMCRRVAEVTISLLTKSKSLILKAKT